ncbi:hypothetical protein, partial [Heyndrickxia coagulans]|uniref:hypothetical protein n=1 Tax=Heyndrickxia coagulans TaxID=1398 RepID=UPI00214DA849
MEHHLNSEPPTNDSSYVWLRDEARLFIQVRNSIEGELIGMVIHCTLVKQLMDHLAFLYSGKGNITRV